MLQLDDVHRRFLVKFLFHSFVVLDTSDYSGFMDFYIVTAQNLYLDSFGYILNSDLIVNPDFEEGDIMSHYGWDVNCSDVKPMGHGTTTEYVSIRDGVQDAGVDLFGPGEGNTGYIYENCRVLYIYQIGASAGYYPVISQNINFDNVDNISFYYCLPYSENYMEPKTFDEVIAFQSTMQAPQNHTIEIYYDDDLIDSIVIDPKFGWQPITVDTTPYSGYGEFKVKIKWTQIKQAMGNMLYLDNFTAVMAPVPEQIDSIISISSINANNVVSGFLKDISGNPLADAGGFMEKITRYPNLMPRSRT